MSYKQYSFLNLYSETEIFDAFRKIPRSRVKYCGNLLRCFRVERLLKSRLFKKSWKDSSQETSPDFHNDKHHIMVEFMKIDDSVNPKLNSFQRKDKLLRNYFGENHKNRLQNCFSFVQIDTSNDDKYNFEGYLNNFKMVLLNHSGKVNKYRSNFPLCKTCVLFICDESNSYCYKNKKNKLILHNWFNDKRFIDIIKECEADFVVWFARCKYALNSRLKEIHQPLAFIYEVRNLKNYGCDYSSFSMIKVK